MSAGHIKIFLQYYDKHSFIPTNNISYLWISTISQKSYESQNKETNFLKTTDKLLLPIIILWSKGTKYHLLISI